MNGVAALDDSTRVIWEPLPPQRLALACPAKEILYGGSKGGGKSDYLVACVLPVLELAHRKWLETGISQKKCRIIVFRKNLEDIKDLIAKSFTIYPAFDSQMGTNGFHIKDKFWEFTSGATVEFRHLDGPTDHQGYNGNEFVMILFDQVEDISSEAYSFLVAQLRSSDPDYRAMLGVRCTANPGGEHGDWVKTHWHIDECPQGGKIFAEKVQIADGRTVETTCAFIRAFLRDNPHLDPDGSYEALMRTQWKYSPSQIRQYLDGDFDCVSGAFFAHLIRPQLHFVQSKPIPGSWDMIHSTDWGSSAPACTLWGARDPDNRIHVIDELHQPGITGRVYGEAMKEKYKHQKWSNERTWRVDDFWGVIDTQAMDRYGSEATAAAGIMESGLRIFAADKLPGERPIGINQLKERLLLDRFGHPQIIVHEDRCPHLVKAIKGIQNKPNDVDDYDPGSPFAHAIDALRFLAMKWTVTAPDDRNPVDLEVERWNRLMTAQASRQKDPGGYPSGY
jgi:hypothetical protein